MEVLSHPPECSLATLWDICEIYVFDIVRQVDSRHVPEEADRQKHQDDWRPRQGANLWWDILIALAHGQFEEDHDEAEERGALYYKQEIQTS